MREVFGSRLATGSSARMNLRLLRQRAGDADALLLAARQGVGAAVGLVQQGHLLEAVTRDLHVGLGEELQARPTT